MRVVVADTGPLHYLVLIGCADILPRLFGAIVVPVEVITELRHPGAPRQVTEWATAPPGWLTVSESPAERDAAVGRLDRGEQATIALASRFEAALVLMDDRSGVSAARARGLAVTGTLGVLDLAARRKLVDLAEALSRLKATSFRYRPELLDALLAQHANRSVSG